MQDAGRVLKRPLDQLAAASQGKKYRMMPGAEKGDPRTGWEAIDNRRHYRTHAIVRKRYAEQQQRLSQQTQQLSDAMGPGIGLPQSTEERQSHQGTDKKALTQTCPLKDVLLPEDSEPATTVTPSNRSET